MGNGVSPCRGWDNKGRGADYKAKGEDLPGPRVLVPGPGGGLVGGGGILVELLTLNMTKINVNIQNTKVFFSLPFFWWDCD